MPGVLTNTDFDQFDFRYSLSKFIDDTYGTLDFYLVTSTSFPMVAGDGIAAGTGYPGKENGHRGQKD